MITESGIVIPDYQIHSISYVMNTIMEKRMRGKKEKAYLIMLNLKNHLKGALVYEPWSMLNGTQHIDFYALSEGWETITSTGYRSHFFQGEMRGVEKDKRKIYTIDEITSFWNQYCLDEGNLDINEPEPQQISLL